MEFHFEQHEEMFLVTPALAITRGECTDPACNAAHWRFSLGWFIWSAHLVF
jgi:hypothetical protein